MSDCRDPRSTWRETVTSTAASISVRLRILLKVHNDAVSLRENEYAARLSVTPGAGEIELF